MTPLALNDLPAFSPWPAILLGAKPFPRKHRTKDEVLREYDREKWGRALVFLQTQPDFASADFLNCQGIDSEKLVAFSVGQELFSANARVVFQSYGEMLVEKVCPLAPQILVELGSGLGDKLLNLFAKLNVTTAMGGEFTSSGVHCGKLLSQIKKQPATFWHFDYNNPETLAQIPKDALVYTSHSIEQIPLLLDSFLEGLIARQPRTVVHFEPAFADHDESTLLGLMRRRYAEMNDYNRNLVELLLSFQERNKLRIIQHDKEVFGVNPLNPTSVIVWEPT